MKLGEDDRRLLALLGTRPRSVSTLVAAFDAPPGEVADRLSALADNGLVSDAGDDRYGRTESGRRVLVTSVGTVDERIDTSPEVEDAIETFDLRADEADAVRHAYAFLRYWGHATDAEIVDAVYDEADAGRSTAAEWWNDLVRGPLAALPGVEEPAREGDPWRYTGTPEADTPLADGRRVLSRTHPVYGDVKHALESLDLADAEREAARAAFAHLYRHVEVTDRDLRETVYPEYPAGYESPGAWLDGLVERVFSELPRVERANGHAWRYRRARSEE